MVGFSKNLIERFNWVVTLLSKGDKEFYSASTGVR